ncbi:MAG: formyltransferase family protein [Devosia sp.]
MEEKIRVALFGGQDLGYVMAEYFSARCDIDLFVVSFHSRRDAINGYRSALTLSKALGIPFIETSRPNEDAVAALREWKPDIIVSAYYARLFSPEILSIPRLGAINVHPGKFPHYQGSMPTPWYIINGEKSFGIGILQIDEGVDTGPVFVQKDYPFPDDETGHGLLLRTQQAAAELYKEYFDAIVRREIIAQPQVGQAVVCPRIEPQYRINWNDPAEIISRQVRVHAGPYFPAYSYLYNRMISINRAVFSNESLPRSVAGEIIAVSDRGLTVACGTGTLVATEYEFFPAIRPEQLELYLAPGSMLS